MWCRSCDNVLSFSDVQSAGQEVLVVVVELMVVGVVVGWLVEE